MTEMQRTIRLRLQPSSVQAVALAETSRQFTSAFNMAAAMGWDAEIGNATKLHYLVYYPVKAAHPTLVSDLVNQARVKAAEAVRSALALKRNGRRFGQPRSTVCPPRLFEHPTIERVSRIFHKGIGGDLAEIYFQGNNRGKLAESSAVILAFFEALVDH